MPSDARRRIGTVPAAEPFPLPPFPMKSLLALTALLTLPAPALADLLVVGNQSGDYADVLSAYQAAEAGDTIYLRPGTYTMVGDSLLVRKPLHFVGSGANVTTFAFSLSLYGQDLGTGEVTVAGLTITGRDDQYSALWMSRCEGPIHLQDLHIDPAGQTPLGASASTGTYIYECDEVTATNCVFEGRDGESTIDEGADGGHAMAVTRSLIALYGCRVLGGEGGIQTQSHYAAFGGGDGGHALTNYGTHIDHAGSAFVGGLGGWDHWNPGSGGYDTAFYQGGALVAMTHARFFFDLPNASAEGSSPNLRAFGPVGTNVFALTSSQRFFRPLGVNFGILHLGGVLDVTFLGQIPAGGQLDVPFVTPSLGTEPVALERIQLFASGAGHRMISDPRLRTIVPVGL